MKKVVLFDAPEDIDQKVVFLARVSSENQDNPKYEGLMKYLIREGHWSPLDMINFTFEVETSRAIARQWLRHSSIKPQEHSQRYSDRVLFESIEFTARLLSPVKILSFDILRQPVITENSNAEFVFKADSNNERINLTISS